MWLCVSKARGGKCSAGEDAAAGKVSIVLIFFISFPFSSISFTDPSCRVRQITVLNASKWNSFSGFCCSQSVLAMRERPPHHNSVGEWGICFSCQSWSALIFSYSGAEWGGQGNTWRHRWLFSFQIHSFGDSALTQKGNLLFSVKDKN